MTLAQIMTLALRQLDEDIEDISEYDDLFRVYANEAYHIAMTEYLKPREVLELESDEDGHISIEDRGISRVVDLRRVMDDGRTMRNIPFDLDGTGLYLRTNHKNAAFTALCEMLPQELQDEDEPKMPSWSHNAIADYICYRHLCNGNMAKQSRAQHYQQAFYQAMRRIVPDGFRSVTRELNLYSASDIRRR